MTVTDRQVLEDLESDFPGVLAWARASEVRLPVSTGEAK